MRKLTIEEVKERVYKVHVNTVILDESTYVDIKTKCRFVHQIYGGWWARPYKVLNGQSHPNGALEKSKKTNLDKYGAENPMQNKEVQEKVKNTNLERYGNEFSFKNKEVQEKIKLTNLERYGVDNPIKNKEIREKIKTINMDRYGVEYPVQNRNIQEKIKKKNVEKFGGDSPFSSLKIREKAKDTIISKYGVDNAAKNKEVQEKIKLTNLDRYGVENSMQNKEIREKAKNTILERFGVEYPAQNKEIALKIAKSSNNSYIKYYWETGKELICQGSYEARVVDYLNINKINYEWQFKIFKMPNNKTYLPDLYLIDQSIWVEIKGWMRKDAQEKWDWFKSEHPTAELWDKKKLKEMGIL